MLSYRGAVSWLLSRLPMYQNRGKEAYRPRLEGIIKICEYLGNPQNDILAIHIAGTNGKGSTSHMLASILHEAGYKVGLYTSPHLKSFRERIKVNGRNILKCSVVDFVNAHKHKLEELNLSFFEMTVAMAFDYFKRNTVDIAIIEVGLGGRLDSTNIITPRVSVITNIGRDHTQLLGHTLSDIASEKAGIIKRKIPVVIGETQSQIDQIFIDKACQMQSKIYFADRDTHSLFHCDLKGKYQIKNQKTTLKTLEVISPYFKTTAEHIQKGLSKVSENTKLRGRWQKLGECPSIYCDIAHNMEGLKMVLSQIKEQTYHKLHLVLGFVEDKDIDNLLKLFPKEATYYFCKSNIERGLNANVLLEKARKYHLNGKSYRSVKEAFQEAKQKANDRDFIYIGGSTFVVAEIL